MKKIIAARMFSRVSISTSGDHLTDALDPSRKFYAGILDAGIKKLFRHLAPKGPLPYGRR
jgi:hypothetical protein